MLKKLLMLAAIGLSSSVSVEVPAGVAAGPRDVTSVRPAVANESYGASRCSCVLCPDQLCCVTHSCF